MYTIYYKPHPSRKSEYSFFSHLWQTFQPAQLCTEPFPFPPSCLNNYVDRDQILTMLHNDTFLTTKKRTSCINTLQSCPKYIKIASNTNKVSFDIIIVGNDNTSYWEYHELQHRSLSIERAQAIYNAATNQPILVPRYIQRLIRDIWRTYYFRPYTIVWKDWFEKHHTIYHPQIPVGFEEYVVPNKFSFSRLLGESILCGKNGL